MGFKPNKPRRFGTHEEVSTRGIDQAGGIDEVAVLLGLSRSQVTNFTEPTHESRLSYDRIRSITRATGATAWAEDLAALAGGQYMPLEAIAGGHDWAQLWDQLAHVSANLIGNLIQRLSDGKVTADECPNLLRDAHDLAALTALIMSKARAVCEQHGKGSPP